MLPYPSRSKARPGHARRPISDRSQLGWTGRRHLRKGCLSHDLHSRPHAWIDIDVRFVNALIFFAQTVPRKFRLRNVLGGMIAAKVVVGAPIFLLLIYSWQSPTKDN